MLIELIICYVHFAKSMSWLAFLGVLLATLTGVISNLKDLKRSNSPTIREWLKLNKYVAILMILAVIGGVLGFFGVTSQKSESDSQKQVIDNLKEQNDKILALSLLERKSNPKVYLFTKRSGLSHVNDSMWQERLVSDSLTPNVQKARSIGFFASNVRNVLFQDDVSKPKFDLSYFGHLTFTIENYLTDQILVSSSGFVDALPGVMHPIKSIRTGVNDRSDTLAFTFEFQNEIEWGNALAALKTKFDNKRAVLMIRRQNPSRKIDKIEFDHIQMTVILSEHPPVRITSELEVRNFESEEDYYAYDLVLKQEPKILVR